MQRQSDFIAKFLGKSKKQEICYFCRFFADQNLITISRTEQNLSLLARYFRYPRQCLKNFRFLDLQHGLKWPLSEAYDMFNLFETFI